MALIDEKIVAVMRDLTAVEKVMMQQAGYKGRKIDDMYNMIHPILAKHGVYCLPELLSERTEERLSNNGKPLVFRILKVKYNYLAEDGSSVSSVVGSEAMDTSDKAFSKAMTMADKTSLIQMFKLHTKEKDPDETKEEIGAATVIDYKEEIIKILAELPPEKAGLLEKVQAAVKKYQNQPDELAEVYRRLLIVAKGA